MLVHVGLVVDVVVVIDGLIFVNIVIASVGIMIMFVMFVLVCYSW